MLRISINKSALLQTEVAALYMGTLPNRVQAAQFNAMLRSKEQMKARISVVAKAARYLQYKIIGSGSTGIKMSISPYPKNFTRKDGGNIQIASSIVLTGKKGGGFIYPKKGTTLKLRSPSVTSGYPKFAKRVRKVRIDSKRKEVEEIAKAILIEEIKNAFSQQGFGVRGGVKSDSTDIVRAG